MKRLTAYTLLLTFLLGFSVPMLAQWHNQGTRCHMACCEAMHHPQSSNATHQMHPFQHQTSCPMLGSCEPTEIPDGFEVQASVSSVKTEIRQQISKIQIGYQVASTSDPLIARTDYFYFTPQKVHTSRDLLSANSILII